MERGRKGDTRRVHSAALDYYAVFVRPAFQRNYSTSLSVLRQSRSI